jgi:transposase
MTQAQELDLDIRSVQMYRDGSSIIGICRALHLSEHRVRENILSAGVTLRGRGRRRDKVAEKARREKASALYRSGLTIREVAKEMTISYRAAHLAVTESGIELRSSGGGTRVGQRIQKRRERVAEIAKDQTLTIEQIGTMIGYGRSTIVADLRALGLYRRNSNSAHAAAVVMLYEEANMSIRQICKELKLSYGCVRHTLLAAGTELRARGGRPVVTFHPDPSKETR